MATKKMVAGLNSVTGCDIRRGSRRSGVPAARHRPCILHAAAWSLFAGMCVVYVCAALALRWAYATPRGGGRRLFPETRELLDEEEEIADLTITNTEIASSLPLQMLLYFNVQYSLFWGLITLSLMVFKVLCMCATAAAFQPLSLPPSLSRYTRNHTCAAAAAHLRQERRVWPWRARLCVCARGSRRRPQDCCMI